MDAPDPAPASGFQPVVADVVAGPTPLPARAALAEVILCSGFPTQLAISGLLRLAGIPPLTGAGELSATFVFALSLADAVLLLALIWWLLARRGERLWDVVTGGRPVLAEAWAGVVSLPVALVIVIGAGAAVQLLAPWLHNVPDNPLEGLLGSQAGLAAFLGVVIVAGGLREEVQRAFLLHRFETSLGGGRVGLAVTSVAFGMGHTLQGMDAAVITALLGAFWGAMYLRRRSAVGPVVCHSLFNSTELLRLVAAGLAP